jgi:hypothetical protein
MQRAAVPRAASAAPRRPQPQRLLALCAAPRRACVALASRRLPLGLCGALRSRAPPCEPPAALRRALPPPLRTPSRSGRSCLARAAEVRRGGTASNPSCAPRARCAHARVACLPQASADAAATLWLKSFGVADAQYAAVKGVDLQVSVDDLKARWVSQEKLDVRPSRVTLRLVSCGPRKPSAAEEAAAAELDDPSLTLAEAGVTGTAWLLAFVAGACCAACIR